MVAAVIGQGIAAAGYTIATGDIIDAIKTTSTQWKGSGHSICTGWGEIDGQATPQAIVEMSQDQPPNARFSISPQSGTAPFTATLDASASNDPDGSIRAYYWKFNGDQFTRGETVDVEFTEDDVGTVEIGLTVTDFDANADFKYRDVTVRKSNEPPEARASYSVR
jgi:PKD repeat protein